MLLTVVAIVIVFFVIVVVHEGGHFIAAKLSGVDVDEFSIGFGPAIYKKQFKKTLFKIGILPLGGYVKLEKEDDFDSPLLAIENIKDWKRFTVLMANNPLMRKQLSSNIKEIIKKDKLTKKDKTSIIKDLNRIIENSQLYLTNSDSKEEDKNTISKYNRKTLEQLFPGIISKALYPQGSLYETTLLKKLFIVLAGPIANTIFAFLVFFFLLWLNGQEYLAPVLYVKNPSLPLKTKDTILQVNNKSINTYSDFLKALKTNETNTIKLKRKNKILSVELNYTEEMDSILLPFLNPVVGGVAPMTPAYEKGIKLNDTIVKIDGKAIETWYDITETLKDTTEHLITIAHNEQKKIKIKPKYLSLIKRHGIGIQVSLGKKEKLPFFTAFYEAGNKTIDTYVLITQFFYKVFVGKQSIKESAGGPIMIAQISAEGARLGIVYFMGFLALISLNLAFFNLIPLPLFDGGRAFIFIFEKLTQIKLTQKAWKILLQISYGLVLILIVLVSFNDILRILKK